MVLWQQILLHFGADDFALKFLLESASKSSFFRFGVEVEKLSLCESFSV